MEIIQDVYLARTTKEKEEYLIGLKDAIFSLIGTDDEEVWGDGQVTMAEATVITGITNYLIKYRGDEVGSIRGEIFEDGSFKFTEIKK